MTEPDRPGGDKLLLTLRKLREIAFGGKVWEILNAINEEIAHATRGATEGDDLPPDAEHPINYRKAFAKAAPPQPAPDAMREALIREVSVLLARHDHRYGLGGTQETEYAFARAYAFTKRAEEVVDLVAALSAPVPSPDGASETRLPCDVHLPPNTYIQKGCTFETLMIAIQQREAYSDEDRTFTPKPGIHGVIARDPSGFDR